MAILDKEHYEAVRKAIDIRVTATTLDDDIIGLSIYAGAAINDVLNIVPDAETLPAEYQTAVTNAAIFFCAARLIDVTPDLTALRMQAKDKSYSKLPWKPDERKADLIEKARDELADLPGHVEPDTSRWRTTFFQVPTGQRFKRPL